MKSTQKSIGKFKAIELFVTFTRLEMKRFGRFLQSPYHNNNQELVCLFEFLRPLYPTFDQVKLTRQKIWKTLFETKPFDAIKFKKLFSELNLLAEEFIIIEHIKSNKRKRQKQLIDALKPRHFKRFVKKSEALISTIEAKKEYQLKEDFWDLHWLYQGLWYHFEWEKHRVNHKELIMAYEGLVAYMAFIRIRTVSELETRKKFLNAKEFFYPNSLNGQLPKELNSKNISYSIYHQFFELEKAPTEEKYFFLKRQTFDYYTILNKEQVQDSVIHLNNYLASRISKGTLGLNKELFNLLQWAAECEIFINEDRILDIMFSNIVIAALKIKQTAWASEYLSKYESYLKSAHRPLVLGYLKASLAFTEQQFEQVLAELATLQPSYQIQYYFQFKSIITRSCFELMLQGKIKYQDILKNELDAFEKGVRRNRKFSKVRKESYLNYIRLVTL